MSNVAVMQKAGLLERMAVRYGLDAAVFERTVAAVAMPQKNGAPDCTREELISCLVVANEHDLNPLTKEIYFMRTKAGVIQPVVSVDGWMKKLNAHPQFDGMEFVDEIDDKGNMVSCTVKIYRKDRSHPTVVTEYMAECKGASQPWQKTERRMLRHRTLTQGARYAVGFAGVMDFDEFQQWQDGLRDVTPRHSSPVIPEIPEVPEIAAVPEVPTEAEVSQDTSQDGVLTDLGNRLEAATSPAQIKKIEREFAAVLASLDEEGRGAAIEMIEAAKARE